MNDFKRFARSRRAFLKTGVAAVAMSRLDLPRVHAAGSDTLRVGLIGCGGRGTGAAGDILSGVEGVKLVAMGDVFKDRLEESRARLKKDAKIASKIDVPDDRCFTGFSAYQNVLSCGIDYVILASPPGFRPLHLQAAVDASKHIFTEKPVAVDGAGVRKVLAVYDQAKARGLAVGAGTQRRHQKGYLETLKRIHDGALGPILGARCFWNQGSLWVKPRQPQWSDVEWQLRNWLYFTWLSGDHIVEQHVHNLDVVNWALRSHPLSAAGMGGRQVRTDPAYGQIFDHFSIDYEYPDGVHAMSMCRQIPGCQNNISESILGVKGASHTDAHRYSIAGDAGWRFTGEDNEPYVQEHIDLVASIRAGKPLNELKNVAESTLTAIMGRMSAYTGKLVTWEQALGSQEDLMPTRLAFGPMPVPPVAVPGQTALL